MLLQSEARVVDSTAAMQTARATIKASSKIFDFFANQTYSDKPKAICRELVANAVDSHVMAGKGDVPVEVWLPTLVDPVFKVRDFGLGMEHSFVMGPFMAYADGSTKDTSNIAIGGFGIGSKSPFAYVDQFTLRSVFDGTLSVYSVFKEEDGIPAIALLSQSTTDEPNGVEVSFPVEVSDFMQFETAAFEALKYFDPLPLIKNAVEGKFNAPEYLSRGKMWRMRKSGGDLQVIMGGVMYPVESSQVSYKLTDPKAKKMLNYGLDIVLPIGACSVALSREHLSYDTKTVEAVQKGLIDVIDEVAKTFETMFDHHKTKWEACQALWEEAHPNGANHWGGLSVRANFLVENARYKGNELKLALPFELPGGTESWFITDRKNRGRGSGNCPNPKWQYAHGPRDIRPGEYERVIIDDLPKTSASRAIQKIRYFVDSQCDCDKQILVVRAQLDDKVTTKQIIKALGNPPKDLVTLTSTLPEPPKVVNAVGASVYVRPHIRMFTYNGSKHHSYYGQRYSTIADGYWENLSPADSKTGVYEVEYSAQPDQGIYVPMENFKPQVKDPKFYEKMKVEIVAWSELHFINAGDAPKLDKTRWREFSDVYDERLAVELAKFPRLGQMLAVLDAMEDDLQKLFRANKIKVSRGPLAKLQKLYREYIEPLGYERKYRTFVDVKLPKGDKPQDLFEDFKEKSPKAYRLLQLTCFDLSHEGDLEFFEENI